MTILDKAQIGDKVKVNIELSSDRLNRETINRLEKSSTGTISDFKITDGKSIGVIVKLSNGEVQWFFENEIDILDETGKVKEKDFATNESKKMFNKIFENLNYENKYRVNDLINPFNFFLWLVASFKDIF